MSAMLARQLQSARVRATGVRLALREPLTRSFCWVRAWHYQSAAPSARASRSRSSKNQAPLDVRRSAATHTSTNATSGSDDMLTSTFATDSRQVLVYDGECNLCQAGVQAMLALDPAGKMRFSAMQSDAGKRLLAAIGRDPNDMSSVVLVEADGSYKTKSDAVLKVAQISENPAAVAAAFSTAAMPSWMRDAAYDGIASNRYSLFGQPDKPSLVDERFSDRFIV